MTTLSQALEAEHHTIDEALESFAAAVGQGEADPTTITEAFTLLRRHIYVEEEFLFPPLRAAGMVMPILVMLREHGDIWRQMDALDDMLADRAPGARVVAACQELLASLERHNAKEEPIVYPEADQVIAEADASELLAFLASGQMPEDWLCEQI